MTTSADELRCFVCNAKGGKRCSACKTGAWCSRECQARDWAGHKLVCGPATGLGGVGGSRLGMHVLRFLRDVTEVYLPIQLSRPAADRTRVEAFRREVSSAVVRATIRGRSPVRVAFFGSGSALLPLLAFHDALEARVTAIEFVVVEQFRFHWGLAQTTCDRNGRDHIRVVHAPRFAELARKLQGFKADVVCLEGFDATVAGHGILRVVDQLLDIAAPAAEVIPRRARVVGVGVALGCSTAGFDLSPFKQFLWSPRAKTVDLSKLNHRELTDPFVVAEYDLTASSSAPERTISARVKEDGEIAAVVAHAEFDISADGSSQLIALPGLPSSMTSLTPVLHRLPESRVKAGDTLTLTVQRSADGSLFVSRDGKSTVPAFKGLLPQLRAFPAEPAPAVLAWHFPMLADEYRSTAYLSALELVIASMPQRPLVLDIGSGSGILSMLAAKAGALSVVGCEAVSSIAACSKRVVKRNGPHKCPVTIREDLSLHLSPGKTPGLFRPADLVVQEVMDAGLLGEGVLQSSAHARKNLLAPNAAAVPAAATVFGALIGTQILDTAYGAKADMAALNTLTTGRFDEEHLSEKHGWPILTEPFVVFEFDFRKEQAIKINQRGLEAMVVRDGVANAVALWFELDMDGGRRVLLSTSPLEKDAAKSAGTAWGQAVHWLRTPCSVSKGFSVSLRATHNEQHISVEIASIADGVHPIGLPTIFRNHEEHTSLEQNIIERDKPAALEAVRKAIAGRASRKPDEPDPWHLIGAIVEAAVYLQIDPDMAADFVLEACQDL